MALHGTSSVRTNRVLTQSAVAVPHTGDTNETTLATVTIPGGSMGPNGSLFVETLFGKIGTTAATIRIKLGGTTVRAQSTGGDASANTAVRVFNRNSQSSQVSFNSAVVYNSSGSTPNETTIDTSADVSLTITAQLGLGSETITLEAYQVSITA